MRTRSFTLVPLLFVLPVVLPWQASAQFNIVSVTDAGENPRELNRDPEFTIWLLDSGWVQLLDDDATDAWTPPIALPFPVAFNGSTYTSCRADQAGVLTFTANPSTTPTGTNYALPAAIIPPNSVCVWGLTLGNGDCGLYTKTFGTAPYRQFWASWYFALSDGVAITTWSIVFEETTQHIYITDQKTIGSATTLTAGVQVSDTEAYQVPGSPNLANHSVGTFDVAFTDNAYYVIKPGAAQQLDAFTEQDATAGYAQPGDPLPVRAQVRNLGTLPITSLAMHYSVDGGAVQSAVATLATPLPTSAVQVVEHPLPWVSATPGVHTIDLWSNAPNGLADEWPRNDTIHFTVLVVDTFAVRHTLIEVFTSSTCGPCVGTNAKLDTVIFPALDNYCLVKYPMSWPDDGDPYHTSACTIRGNYYGISSIPKVMVDSHLEGTQFMTPATIEGYQEMPAYVSMQVNDAYYTGTTVECTVDLHVLADLPSFTNSLQLAVVEKLTTGNVSTNGETEFHHTFLKMAPTPDGQFVGAVTAGTSLSFPYSIDMSGTFVEEMHDLEVVAWVQQVLPSKAVLQSACAEVLPMVGIPEARHKHALHVWPSPAQGAFNVLVPQAFTGPAVRMVLLDAQQREVWSSVGVTERVQVDVPFAPGIYTLVLMAPDERLVTRVVLTR